MHHRLLRLLVAAVAALGLIAAGCGGSDSGSGSDTGSDTQATPSTSTPSTDTSGGSSSGAPAGATQFVDPAGAYQISIDPSWKGVSEQPKAWSVGAPENGFTTNVNIVTETLPSSDIKLDQYIDVSLKNIKNVIQGVEVETQETITLASGAEAARLVYSGTVSGKSVKFLQVVHLNSDAKRVAIATLTSTPDGFDKAGAATEDYLRTLETLGGN